MALRREDLTPEQLVLQEAYDRSWESLQQARADPEMMAFLRDSLARLKGRDSSTLTPEQAVRQAAYAATWADQRRMVADPDTMAFLRDCFDRLDERPAAPPITGDEFLVIISEPVE